VTPRGAEGLIQDMFILLPLNDFFTNNKAILVPVIANALLVWKASYSVERLGLADAKSFVWRASFYNVVLQVVQIFRGMDYAMENAHKILSLYGENLSDYQKEFPVSNQLSFDFTKLCPILT
jgi:hypothetical protein